VVNIRRAEMSDLDWMMVELEKFAAFLDSDRSVWCDDTEYTLGVVRDLIDKHLIFIAEKEETKMGFIIGLITAHWFNPEIRQLSELAWWVQEEHRRSSAGLKLLNALVKWGEENCDWVTCSLEANSPVNDDCLIKRGFKKFETTYLKEVR
jgi:RimJ/RimL family protein N-acetyltransferase